MYISNKRELNDNKATLWSSMQTFKMMLLRIFDNTGNIYILVPPKKDAKLYVH